MKTTLQKSCRQKWAIHINTTHPDKDTYGAIVLTHSKSLVVFQEERAFELDGINILPRTSIESVRDTEVEQCCNLILRENGQMRRLSGAKWIRELKTIRQAIQVLYQRKIWPAIEVVWDDQSALYIGPITAVTNRNFRLLCYDAAGEWEKEYTIAHREVFRIDFWGAYTNHFNAHMKASSNPVPRTP
jgi:hypothetical protein